MRVAWRTSASSVTPEPSTRVAPTQVQLTRAPTLVQRVAPTLGPMRELMLVNRTLVEPMLVELMLVNLTRVDPMPVDPMLVDPTRVDPMPVEPMLVDSMLVDPMLVDPTPVEPMLVEPMAVDPMLVSTQGFAMQESTQA